IDDKIGALLGSSPKQLTFNDLAVNPASGRAYVSISRGKGPDATPVLVRIDREGKINEVALKDIKFAKAALPDAPAPDKKDRRGQPVRLETITGLAFVDGRVIVAGLSNEEFASTLRAIPFPFSKTDRGSSIEIYHGSHGKFETNAPVRTFTPYTIAGEAHI